MSETPVEPGTRAAARATTPAAGRRHGGVLPPAARKVVLVVHVAISVSWLGLTVGLLTLGITALTTGDAELVRAAYLAMGVFGDVLVAPVSLGALATGLLLALGTHWGLRKHFWVMTKFLLTMVAVGLTLFSLRSGLADAAAIASTTPNAALLAGGIGEEGAVLVVAPSVGTVMYTTITAISVVKPWGRTAYGRRKAGMDT